MFGDNRGDGGLDVVGLVLLAPGLYHVFINPDNLDVQQLIEIDGTHLPTNLHLLNAFGIERQRFSNDLGEDLQVLSDNDVWPEVQKIADDWRAEHGWGVWQALVNLAAATIGMIAAGLVGPWGMLSYAFGNPISLVLSRNGGQRGALVYDRSLGAKQEKKPELTQAARIAQIKNRNIAISRRSKPNVLNDTIVNMPHRPGTAAEAIVARLMSRIPQIPPQIKNAISQPLLDAVQLPKDIARVPIPVSSVFGGLMFPYTEQVDPFFLTEEGEEQSRQRVSTILKGY